MNKPASVTITRWLKANLGPRSLAGCTSHDTAALLAAVQVAELWLRGDHNNRKLAAQAFACCVRQMQEGLWHLPYHATAHMGDWSHRSQLWQAAGLPVIRVPVCRFGPQPQQVLPLTAA